MMNGWVYKRLPRKKKKEWRVWGGAGEIAFLQLRFVAIMKS